MPKLENGLFIFHRDFRLEDNIGLITASKQVKNLYVCFIFTPEQVSSKNEYRSKNSIQFMIESLQELSETIKKKGGELMIFYNKNMKVLSKLISTLQIQGIYYNKDYSPYALKRDEEIRAYCKTKNIECIEGIDYYLYEPGTITTNGSNEAFKKYTPFYNFVINKYVEDPNYKKITNIKKSQNVSEQVSLEEMYNKFTADNNEILVHGGRKEGLKRLTKSTKDQKNYDDKRDFFKEKTTHLSAYIKFGCVSIREVYHSIRKSFGLKHGIIRELIWREFFAHVLFAYPEVVGSSYQPRYKSIKWRKSKTDFEKWKNGNTGFPMVDACMRELNTTGYMHNRGRMTVASFLIKTLLLDWQWGEKYFAQNLTDYDLASNNGNWQGISGTGVDMKPYFRDMNPWIQSSKFDNEAIYIKKWIPELKDVDSEDIHNWYEKHTKYKQVKYPKPMVDYYARKEEMIKMYKNA